MFNARVKKTDLDLPRSDLDSVQVLLTFTGSHIRPTSSAHPISLDDILDDILDDTLDDTLFYC